MWLGVGNPDFFTLHSIPSYFLRILPLIWRLGFNCVRHWPKVYFFLKAVCSQKSLWVPYSRLPLCSATSIAVASRRCRPYRQRRPLVAALEDTGDRRSRRSLTRCRRSGSTQISTTGASVGRHDHSCLGRRRTATTTCRPQSMPTKTSVVVAQRSKTLYSWKSVTAASPRTTLALLSVSCVFCLRVFLVFLQCICKQKMFRLAWANNKKVFDMTSNSIFSVHMAAKSTWTVDGRLSVVGFRLSDRVDEHGMCAEFRLIRYGNHTGSFAYLSRI